MPRRVVTRHALTAAAVALSLLSLLFAPLAVAAAKAQPAVDGGWPRAYETPSGARIVLYQPQISAWEGQKQMTAYVAVSYLPMGAKEPSFGSVKVQADTKVAVEERLVSFASLELTEANFPTLQKEQTREVVSEITAGIPKEERVIALDRVLAAVDKSQIIPKNAEGIKADPPTVYCSTKSAVLVIFDGEPIWSPIKDNNLKFAVNTNWDVFQDSGSGTFYLRDGKAWLKATDLKGTWMPAGTLPDSFNRLPDADWSDVRGALPGQKIAAADVPAVVVSEAPAEMILLQGQPAYEPIRGTDLLWVRNTESDLFRLGATGAFYFLVAGRWFSAADLKGPWTFATPTLPADFKSIPPEHPRSRVLASVPGTPQAIDAVLLAQIPQTARVNIKETKAPEVVYEGQPRFEPIENTSLQRAVNTDKDILKVGDLYYMCFQGVWFMSASPNGPWSVTKSVPDVIYTIPASSPVYNVTYVTVQDSDDDDWAEFVCAAGYTGVIIAWGCAVWGTGHYYPPYVWHDAGYPIYYPHPVTYGCAAAYNPWTGRYTCAVGAYGPYGGAGVAAVYNPRTGRYARGGVVYGPYGAAGAARAWNPRTGVFGATRQGTNVYGSWGSSYVQRGDDWASTRRYTSHITGDTTRVTRTDQGVAVSHRGGPGDNAIVVKGDGGNVYAGRDGNVYKREDGEWQQVHSGGDATAHGSATKAEDRARSAKPAAAVPQPVDRSSASAQPLDRATADQLNRDFRARAEGAQRTNDFGKVSAGGRTLNTSSYRPIASGAGASVGGSTRAGIGGGGRGRLGGRGRR